MLTSRVYDVARETPLDKAPRLSERLDNEVLLKREDLQPVFSFKLRGAYNKIANLSDKERARGVIAASAGNHAQGVAFSAQKLGLRDHRHAADDAADQGGCGAIDGAEVVLAGDSYNDAKAHCDTLVSETGMTFIHPFDDPLVIAGQGTIGAEILRQPAAIVGRLRPGRWRRADRRHRRLHQIAEPDVKIIGVEPFEADAMYRLAGAWPARARSRRHLADGVAVREVGSELGDRAPGGGRGPRHQRRDSARRSRTYSTTRGPSWSRRRAGGCRCESLGGARGREEPVDRRAAERRQNICSIACVAERPSSVKRRKRSLP